MGTKIRVGLVVRKIDVCALAQERCHSDESGEYVREGKGTKGGIR
jgi:hypothetical protein